MTSPNRPWWQLVLEGHAVEGAPEFPQALGIRPSGWEPGVARFDWAPPGWTRVPGGWVQGGFLGVVLDMAQTFSLFTELREGFVAMTLEMKVSFLSTPLAEEFVVEGRKLKVGRTAAHTEGSVTTPDGTVIATSTATFVVRDMTG